MKKTILKKSALAAMLFAIMSCGKDDAPTIIDDAIDDNSVENTAPTISAQSFSVSEDVLDTDVLGSVTATDSDGDTLSFSIKTNSNDLFEINNTGEISLASTKNLDYETATSHTLSVDVSDGNDTSTADITINVTDILDAGNTTVSTFAGSTRGNATDQFQLP